MSDSEDYEYEYDESDQDDGGDQNDNDEFEYTDDDEGNAEEGEVALENAYYNAKGMRDAGEYQEAAETFESVVKMEVAGNKKKAGVDDDEGDDDDAMDVSDHGGMKPPLKYHGTWGYKAIKQLVKLHLRSVDGAKVMKDYHRMLRVASSPDAAISPNAVEKGVNGMLERVSSLINSNSASPNPSVEGGPNDPCVLARNVYDTTLRVFHPSTGISPNERLWFKTNLKYGQLLYEMNETAKLQIVIRDLLQSSGQSVDFLEGSGNGSGIETMGSSGNSGGTHVMEIAALQIQLYSRLKDTKKLRQVFQRAMSVRGGIPHPRTLALIQELGGKMHMSQRNFVEASQSFFQAFKSYDEAGDRARLRCLKYLVMASMLDASSINPFDSHEARAHRDDPEIVAMTNLVQAFHNDDIREFERILRKNEGRLMDDEFVREHVGDLLRTIRTQVIMRSIGPYTRIRLTRIAKDLNDIPVDDVESLLVSLILDGKLEGRINQVNGVLVKSSQPLEKSDASYDNTNKLATGSIQSRNIASIMQLTSALENLTTAISKTGSQGSIEQVRVM
mmetsp:Transcript_28059/g.58994  ORF Transcript_28059/g.58994 Transcript_28059/m.58994 type:complete len:559 (-) Transcript_28059:1472-3148(-)